MLGWWFAFTRDLRRERTFIIDDMPSEAGAYGGLSKSTPPENQSRSPVERWHGGERRPGGPQHAQRTAADLEEQHRLELTRQVAKVKETRPGFSDCRHAKNQSFPFIAGGRIPVRADALRARCRRAVIDMAATMTDP